MTQKTTTHLIILAAGKGTRMASAQPKVMHAIASLPMLGHVLKAAKSLSFQQSTDFKVTVVLAPSMEDVAVFAKTCLPDVAFAYQKAQYGTAHAVSCALETLDLQENDQVVVLFGDTPLIQPTTLSHVTDVLKEHSKAGVVVAGMVPQDPKSYGRLVCDTAGRLLKIVEFKHASETEKKIGFCNSGIMAFRADCLQKILPAIQAQSLNGEYYLTDAIELAHSYGVDVRALEVPAQDVEGVNTRSDLAQAEKFYQERRRQEALTLGCTMIAPETVYFSHDTVIEPDVLIEPHVFFGPGVCVKSHATLKAFSHLEGAIIAEHATIGPFARLRPGTVIGENARIGNFVEVKNATFSKGAKASHLSYVGDASVGVKANIGAGTITCNYDGYFKHKTVIADGAFIGSNSCLVAPVSVGKGAIVGAASTITKNVEADALVVSRAPQRAFEGKAKEMHQLKSKLKKKVA